MLKSFLPIAVVAALAAMSAAGFWDIAGKKSFRYAGTVEAIEVRVPARVSSTISAVAVQEGDAVKKGQPLVELGCEDLKIEAGIAQRDFERSEKLYKAGSSPYEAYERALNRRDLTALNVAWCRIDSPTNGIVLARLHEPGEWAGPGKALLTLVDMDEVYVYVYVPQEALHRLKPGDAVNAFLPEAGDAPRRGTIAFIRPQAEFTPKNVQTREERTRLVFGVKVRLDNADRVLKPGMPIEVSLGQ